MTNIAVPLEILFENRTEDLDARVRKLVCGFREKLQISDDTLYEIIMKSMAFLKIVTVGIYVFGITIIANAP